MVEFRKVGKSADKFVQAVENDRALFDFFANTLRSAMREQRRFNCSAELTSIAMSVKNAIGRVGSNSAKAHDYNLCLSFTNAMETVDLIAAA
jgi:hypothetical protein